mgnify:CR=1 FL=1
MADLHKISGKRLKEKLFPLAKKLAKMPKDAEYAIVVFEDGYISPIISQKYYAGALVPVKDFQHGYAIAVLHTHPLPRVTPSLADLRLLIIMSMYNIPTYLGTIYKENDKVIFTLYIANRSINTSEARLILNKSYIYEIIHRRYGFKEEISEKQLREQHRFLQKFGISIERYFMENETS